MFGYVHHYYVLLHIFTYIISPSRTEESTLAFHKSAHFSGAILPGTVNKDVKERAQGSLAKLVHTTLSCFVCP